MRFPLEHHEIPTNGIRLHVVQSGPATGPLVLLLHGFPESGTGGDISSHIWPPPDTGCGPQTSGVTI
jgi:pimeloyl-ACP methyl ester carboxylesterase